MFDITQAINLAAETAPPPPLPFKFASNVKLYRHFQSQVEM